MTLLKTIFQPLRQAGSWARSSCLPALEYLTIGLDLCRSALHWGTSPKVKPRVQLALVGALAFLALGGASPADLLERVASWPGYGRGPALDVAVTGHFAYVAIGHGGLIVLDVSDPARPVRAGGYWAAGTTCRVRVDGARAFVVRRVQSDVGGCVHNVQHGYLDVLDLSEPAQPKLVASHPTGSEIADLRILGTRAYLLETRTGLEVLDITNPARPIGLGTHLISGAYGLDVADGRMAVVGSASDGGSFVVSDLSLPPKGEWPIYFSLPNVGRTVRLQHGRAYVGGAAGLSVFKMNPPAGSGGAAPTPKPVMGLALAATNLYAATAEAGLTIFDISNLDAPQPLSNCDTPGSAVALAVAGDYAYIADYDGGLQIVDVSDHGHPRLAGSYDTGLTTRQIRVIGDRAFVLSSGLHEDGATGKSRLECISLTNLAQPALLALYETAYHVPDFTISGSLACLWCSTEGTPLELVDWSDLARPRQLALLTPKSTGAVADAFLSGSNVFIALEACVEIFALDPKDPASPRWLATYAATANVRKVRVQENNAYVATDGGLEVVDVSDPARPVKRGEWDGDHVSCALSLSGNQAYLAAPEPTGPVVPDPELTILDVRDPSHPSQLGTFHPSALVTSLATEGRYACLAEGEEGLEIVEVSNPAQPLNAPGASDLGTINCVQTQAGLVYVADAGQGLIVLKPRSDLAIVQPPQSLTVTVGQPGSLTVFATGPGSLTYQWYWGQSGNTMTPIAGATGPNLQTPALQSETNLWVRVSGGTRAVDSTTVHLGVASALALERLGSWPGYRMGPATAVQIAGHCAYVAAGTGGLMVFDISDPAAPRRIGGCEIGDAANAIALSGDHAIMTGGNVLKVIDVSQPSQPRVVGGYSGSSYFDRVVVAANYAYAAASGSSGPALEVFDISNPINPQRVGAYTAPHPLSGVVVRGLYAYLTEEWDTQQASAVGRGGFEVIDLTDPAKPQRRVALDTAGLANGLAIAGNFAYVTEGVSGQPSPADLEVIDISDPAQPRRVNSLKLGDWARNPTLAGSRFYCRGEGIRVNTSQLRIFDLSNPIQPEIVGSYIGPDELLAFAVSDGLACLPLGDDGVELVDVTNAARPQRFGGADTGRPPNRLSVASPYALLTYADPRPGLEIVEVSNPQCPRSVGQDNTVGGSFVQAALPDAYFGNGEVLDLSNPGAPKHVGRFDSFLSPADLAIQGGVGYLVEDHGLQVFDVSNPSRPIWLGGYYAGLCNAVSVAGNVACLAKRYDGLSTYDVTVPGFPARLGVYLVSGGSAYANDVVLSNRLAYVAVSDGLDIVDLSDPARPVSLAKTLRGTGLDRLCPFGHYVLAINYWGLEIVDVSNPAQPIVAGHFDAPETTDVGVDGSTIYLAQGTYGLTILRLTSALRLNSPTIVGNNLRISWAASPQARLQWTPNLSPAQWQDVPGTEGVSQIDLPRNVASGFFRLMLP